jgi:hypothetical protein
MFAAQRLSLGARAAGQRYERATHDLQLDGLALELDGANLKVDADRGDVALRVRVVRESEKQAGLRAVGISRRGRDARGDERRTLPTPESPMRRSLNR